MVVAIGYMIAFPSIKYSATPERKEESGVSVTTFDRMDIVMRIAKPDERAALEVLQKSGGTCLQKDITYKTGLSKLKTHRIVARLAERGIIQVKKAGKTNEIIIPAWLKTRNTITNSGQAETN
jgi:predicted transcriptional regulator